MRTHHGQDHATGQDQATAHDPATAPELLACSHGTDDPQGQRAVSGLVEAVAARLHPLPVRLAYVDVQQPSLAASLAARDPQSRDVVVVPLLLSAGYHVHVDVAQSVAQAGPSVRAAGALGPDPALVEMLQERLAEAGAGPGDAVVLAAAGSSDPRAVQDVERLAAALGDLRGGEVRAGYLSAASPTVAQAVQAARDAGAARVVAASYLLAPGYFQQRLQAVPADVVTAPLLRPGRAPDPRLVSVVVERYRAAADSARIHCPDP